MPDLAYSDAVTWIAGCLQLSVACYALRLNRLFGAARVGWSMFSAFFLLAILHLLQSAHALSPLTEGGKVDVIYALVSMLLLTGMLHIECLLKERVRLQAEEKFMRTQLETIVAEKTAGLTQANTELAAEVAERKRIATQMEATYNELLTASREAGMSEVASNVLHNVGNVLNSVNISASVVADHLARFRVGSLSRVASLLREHSKDLPQFLANDPRGKQLPAFLIELSEHLVNEQTSIISEMSFVKKKIEHIKDIVAMQQNYARVAGLTETVKITDLVEDAIQMNLDALARHDIKIVRDFDHSVPEITVEKHKVLQVLVNLVRNAKYACDESGNPEKLMTVRVSNAENRVQISVIDNGIGIPPENLTKIFIHGFTTKKEGHGFGLHSGALAAKDMGGVLRAQSAGVGKGAHFTLELPNRPPEQRK